MTRTLLTRTHEQLSAFSAASAKQIVVTVGGNTTTNTSAVFQPAQITNATIGDTIFFNCEFSSRVFVGNEEERERLSRRLSPMRTFHLSSTRSWVRATRRGVQNASFVLPLRKDACRDPSGVSICGGAPRWQPCRLHRNLPMEGVSTELPAARV